jgi:hypothetical protein
MFYRRGQKKFSIKKEMNLGEFSLKMAMVAAKFVSGG